MTLQFNGIPKKIKQQAREWIDKALGELIVNRPSEPKLCEKK